MWFCKKPSKPSVRSKSPPHLSHIIPHWIHGDVKQMLIFSLVLYQSHWILFLWMRRSQDLDPRIPGWFGLEWTLKFISFQTLPLGWNLPQSPYWLHVGHEAILKQQIKISLKMLICLLGQTLIICKCIQTLCIWLNSCNTCNSNLWPQKGEISWNWGSDP